MKHDITPLQQDTSALDHQVTLLQQCDAWAGWMSHWLVLEAGELMFFAPDNDMLVSVPELETLADAVSFLKKVNSTSTAWSNAQ